MHNIYFMHSFPEYVREAKRGNASPGDAVELNHLKYFYVVAKEGSFTRAAKALRIQQPTISKTVRLLEADLGVTLLERLRSGVQLTHAGAEIFRNCEEIFSRIDQIRSVPGQESGDCQGPLSFGMTDAASSYLAPAVLKEYLGQHPQVRPSMFGGSSNLIVNELLEGRVEFGVFFTRPLHDEFLVKDLVKVPFVVVVATRHLGRPRLRQSLIISRDIDYPKARPFPVLAMLKRNHIQVNVALSSNNLDSQKHMVLAGLGIALLPRFMVKGELQSGDLSTLYPKRDFNYTLKLVTRKRRALSKNASTFLDFFARVAPGLL
jgi:DNA-binding transcriptional LysR family regulator